MSGETYELREALAGLDAFAPLTWDPRIQRVFDAARKVVDAPPTVEIIREQLDAWTGRTLSDEEVEELEEAIPNSSIPEAIGVISDHLPSKNARVDSHLYEEEGAHQITTRHTRGECPYDQED